MLHILAVDDDPLILMNIAAMLEELGHRVSEACSGMAAMELITADDSIDLLITDQSMPQMTGLELLEKTRELRPSIPAILASGYGEAVDCPQDRVVKLAKPFRLDDLAAALVQAQAVTSVGPVR